MKNLIDIISNWYRRGKRNIRKVAQASSLVGSLIFGISDFAYTYPREEKYIIGIHGISQDWNAWRDLETTLENKGFKVEGINLPNKGHDGWEKNRAMIDQQLKSIPAGSKVQGMFGYSLGGVSSLRYLEENPSIIENNKGGKLVLLDPAVKSSFGKVLASEPMRPIVAPFIQRLTPTQTQNELTGKDPEGFLDKTWGDLNALASNLAKNNWGVDIINLHSEIVDGKAIDNLAQKLKEQGVDVNVHTPDQVMNNYSLPTPGNRGNFPKGSDTLRENIPEYTRKSSVHAYWSPTYKGALADFIQEKFTEKSANEKGIIPELKDPRRYDVEEGKLDYKDDKKNYRGPNNTGAGGEQSIDNTTVSNLPLKQEKEYGGIDLRNITLSNVSTQEKQDDKIIYTGPYGGITFSNLALIYLAEDNTNNHHTLKYALKATSGKNAIDIEKSSALSLESLLNWIILPDEIFWVNLNPKEPERIIDERLKQTDIGEILLKADLQLKKESAKLTDPRTLLGKIFWDNIKEEGQRKEIALSNRLWIVPGKVEVYADDHEIYIKEAKIDVMLESEYLSSQGSDTENREGKYAKKLMRTLILPKITKAVNENEEFEDLRQVFYARVLAQWYERKLTRGLVNPSQALQEYERKYARRLFTNELLSRSQVIERNRIWDPKKIFDDYVRSYKEGEYSFSETEYHGNYRVAYHYFMGGVNFINIMYNIINGKEQQKNFPPEISRKLFYAISDQLGSQEGNEFYFGGVLTAGEK